MSQVTLKAKVRKESGTGASRQIRSEKLVPAVLYGRGIDSRLISVAEPDMVALFNSGRAMSLIDMTVGRKKYSVMIKEIQRDRIKGHPIHIDFYAVDLDQPVNATVAIHLHGDANGVKEGGILQHQLRELDIRCLPAQLPNRLELDISDLAIGESKTVADIDLPDGIELLVDLHEPVVSITAPRAEVAEDEAETDGEPAQGEESADESAPESE